VGLLTQASRGFIQPFGADTEVQPVKIRCDLTIVKLLKPTGHVIHQQFNIQQLYVLPTLCLCVLYLSQNKQRLVPLTA